MPRVLAHPCRGRATATFKFAKPSNTDPKSQIHFANLGGDLIIKNCQRHTAPQHDGRLEQLIL